MIAEEHRERPVAARRSASELRDRGRVVGADHEVEAADALDRRDPPRPSVSCTARSASSPRATRRPDRSTTEISGPQRGQPGAIAPRSALRSASTLRPARVAGEEAGSASPGSQPGIATAWRGPHASHRTKGMTEAARSGIGRAPPRSRRRSRGPDGAPAARRTPGDGASLTNSRMPTGAQRATWIPVILTSSGASRRSRARKAEQRGPPPRRGSRPRAPSPTRPGQTQFARESIDEALEPGARDRGPSRARARRSAGRSPSSRLPVRPRTLASRPPEARQAPGRRRGDGATAAGCRAMPLSRTADDASRARPSGSGHGSSTRRSHRRTKQGREAASIR